MLTVTPRFMVPCEGWGELDSGRTKVANAAKTEFVETSVASAEAAEKAAANGVVRLKGLEDRSR